MRCPRSTDLVFRDQFPNFWNEINWHFDRRVSGALKCSFVLGHGFFVTLRFVVIKYLLDPALIPPSWKVFFTHCALLLTSAAKSSLRLWSEFVCSDHEDRVRNGIWNINGPDGPDAVEQGAGFLCSQHRRLALLEGGFGAAHGVGRVQLQDLAGHQPVKQNAKRRQVLLDGSRGQLALQVLNESGDVDRLHLDELPDLVFLTLGRKAAGSEELIGGEQGVLPGAPQLREGSTFAGALST